MIKINNLPNKKELDKYSENFNQIFVEIKNKKHLIKVINYFNGIGYCSNYEDWKSNILKDSILSNIRSVNPNDLKKVHYITVDTKTKLLSTQIDVKVEFSKEDYFSLANEKILIIDVETSAYNIKYFKKKLRI